MPKQPLDRSTLLLLFGALSAAAVLGNFRGSTVPNRLCLAIALLYPAQSAVGPVAADRMGALTVATMLFTGG